MQTAKKHPKGEYTLTINLCPLGLLVLVYGER